jgi:hypothetical protein
MYSRSAKGGEKGDPNRNPWLAKMWFSMHNMFLELAFIKHSVSQKIRKSNNVKVFDGSDDLSLIVRNNITDASHDLIINVGNNIMYLFIVH